MPETLTPIFLAVALNVSARLQVSWTALIPCSVNCMVVMKVAIGTFPPQRDDCRRGIVSPLPGPGVRWLWAGVGLVLVTPTAFEGEVESAQGLRNPPKLGI